MIPAQVDNHDTYATVVEEPGVSISAAAERYGISLRALRFYEQQGLLQPRRRGPVRFYDGVDLSRVAEILRGKRLGFTLREIRDMLGVADPTTPALALEPERIVNQIDMLERQHAEIEKALFDLKAIHARLSTADAACELSP